MATDDRAALIEKIKAMLAKTIDNGCTEAEAEIALAKASAMMEVYQISDADLELTKSEKATLSKVSTGKHNIGSMLANAVARFTHTKVWKTDKELNFCGLPIDIDLATFLLASLVSFTEREMVDYLARVPHSRGDSRALINGFSLGCCNRINARLDNLTAKATPDPREAPRAGSTSTALAVVQGAAIKAYMAEHGIHLQAGHRSRRATDSGARQAGAAAGDRASFGRPIGRGGALRLS